MNFLSIPDKKNSIPEIYMVTGLIALIYSGLMIVFSIYKQFFYIDGTWTHGFIANGFAILSSLIWIGILFVFKNFLNEKLNYFKANSLIITYIIFLALSSLSLATVVIKSINLYQSLAETGTIDSSTAFASTSVRGAILLFISTFAIILICILLGNRIRKIDVVAKELFKLLGFSLIAYGILSLLVTLTIIDNDTIQLLIKAALAILVGLILKKVCSMDSSVLSSLVGLKKISSMNESKPKLQNKVSPDRKLKKPEKPKSEIKKVAKIKRKESSVEYNEIPNININELENKEIVLSYFENLSEDELSRLELIVSKEYSQKLTKEQKTNLVINYISINKLYDHQRYAPK